MKFHAILGLSMMVTIALAQAGRPPTNEIVTMQMRQGLFGDSLEFFCTQEPVYNVIPTRNENLSQRSVKKLVFFMPLTNVRKNVQEYVELVNQQAQGVYFISCSPVSKPVKGVAFKIVYDDSKVNVAVRSLDIPREALAQNNLLDSSKGIVFHFYDKNKLADVSSKRDSILHYAYCSNTLLSPALIIYS
jgi:hypothetical protein